MGCNCRKNKVSTGAKQIVKKSSSIPRTQSPRPKPNANRKTMVRRPAR